MRSGKMDRRRVPDHTGSGGSSRIPSFSSLFGKVLATGVSFMINISLSHFLVLRRQAGESARCQ